MYLFKACIWALWEQPSFQGDIVLKFYAEAVTALKFLSLTVSLVPLQIFSAPVRFQCGKDKVNELGDTLPEFQCRCCYFRVPRQFILCRLEP